MKLEEFLHLENPHLYDFKCEMPAYYEKYKNMPYWKNSLKYDGMINILRENALTFSMNGDAIRRYQLYKILGNCGADFDCDSSNNTCDLTNEIYKALWGFEPDTVGSGLLSAFGGQFGGDTMHSFDNIYRIAKTSKYCDGETERLLKELTSLYSAIGNFVLVPR